LYKLAQACTSCNKNFVGEEKLNHKVAEQSVAELNNQEVKLHKESKQREEELEWQLKEMQEKFEMVLAMLNLLS
jgi:hypothetical protein